MSSDVFIIVACTLAGFTIGGVRCVQAIGAGSYRSSSAVWHIVRGAVVGLVLGLLITELKEFW